jgi:flagellar biosynthesis GTPase FlhF
MSDEKLLNTNWNRIAGAREAVNAREQTGWKAKNEKRYEDPEYARRVAKSISETYSTPEGRKKQSDKQHPQTEETKQKLHLAFVGKIRKGEDWVADMAKTQKGNNFRAKPVITPMGVFASKKTAAAFYIDNEHTTRKTIPSVICWIDVQIKKPNSGFSFISKEEYIILTGKDI